MIRPVPCAVGACARSFAWLGAWFDRPWLRPRCVVIRRYYDFVPWIRRPCWAWAPGECGAQPSRATGSSNVGADRSDSSPPGGLRPWPFRVHRVVLPGEAGVPPEAVAPQPPGKWLDVTA